MPFLNRSFGLGGGITLQKPCGLTFLAVVGFGAGGSRWGLGIRSEGKAGYK